MRNAAMLAMLLLPPGAAAQQTHDAFSVGPRLVFLKTSDADHGQWAPGAQLRVPMGKGYMVEVSVDRARYRAQGVDVRDTVVQTTLLGFFAPDSSISPFLLVGGGWYLPKGDAPYVNPHRRFGPHVGGGMELLLGKSLSIDGSYRFLWTQVHHLWDPLRWFGRDFRRRGQMLTGAINYRF